jgi:serine/threonine protein phosphatase PrpC
MSAPIISYAAPASDRGRASYQQDRAVARADLLAVFDGHGTYGEEAAISVADSFAAAPNATPFESVFADAHVAFRNTLRTHLASRGVAFTETEGAFYKPAGFSYYPTPAVPHGGGTTATAVRIDATGAMTAAHVGDSEAMYFDADDAPGVTLCVGDHTPTSLGEFKRVRATCARPAMFVFGGSPQTRHIFLPAAGDYVMNPAGGFQYADVRNSWAAYVRSGDDMLAMTRALGDFNLHRNGLITTPDVTTVAAPAAGVTRAVVVASDGLWDAVHYDEVRAVVRRADLLGNAAAATAALLEFGITMSKKRFGCAAAHDNITVVVAYVTTPAIVHAPAAVTASASVLVTAAAAAAIASMPPSLPTLASLLLTDNNYTRSTARGRGRRRATGGRGGYRRRHRQNKF